jgi:vacuolar-type H+-ATPase subunit E/Vma4
MRVNLSQIKDIFNAVGERIEKISKDTDKDTILRLLNSAILMF